MNDSIRLNKKQRLLLLRCIRYAFNGDEMRVDNGGHAFELFSVARRLARRTKGKGFVYQGHWEMDSMAKELDRMLAEMKG